MTGSGDRVTRSGDSDMVTFEVENTPQPDFLIRQIGDDPEIRYRYDYEKRGDPTPEDFERVNHLEVKLVSAMTDWDGDVEAAASDAHEAICDLKEAMLDARDLSDDERGQVSLGNLDGLPEVEKIND